MVQMPERFSDGRLELVDIAEADRQDGEAKDFVLAYKGTFEFLLDIKSRFADDPFYELSPAQVGAVLRCKANEERQRAPREASGIDLSVLPKGSHHYAVTNADGNTTFLQIDNIDEGNWEGWVFVKQIIGGGNEQRLGKQRPDSTYDGQWPSLIKLTLDNPSESMARYGRELGHCGWCGKTLTDATSRSIGIGPVCREGMAL